MLALSTGPFLATRHAFEAFLRRDRELRFGPWMTRLRAFVVDIRNRCLAYAAKGIRWKGQVVSERVTPGMPCFHGARPAVVASNFCLTTAWTGEDKQGAQAAGPASDRKNK